jgi:H+/Cl- antiporter ClcA
MISRYPTQSTPGGCLLGLIGVFFAAFGALGVWGLYRWISLPARDKSTDSVFWFILTVIVTGIGCAVLFFLWAIKVLRNTDFRGYDSKDPDKKGLKW